MERFSRSMSSREKPGGGGGGSHPSSMRDLRSFSTSDFSPNQNRDIKFDDFKKEIKTKKGSNGNKSKISASPSKKNWNFNGDNELQRKKRVAGYKAYAVEGKVKNTFKKSVRWMKGVVHGIW